MKTTRESSSVDDTTRIAEEIAARLQQGDVIYLQGDLGAGKTTLAMALSAILGADPGEVASPTFALIHQYPTDHGMISHLDGYRLSEGLREWQEIGAAEIARESRLTMIEWPGRQLGNLIPPDLTVSIAVGEEGKRTIELDWSSRQARTE